MAHHGRKGKDVVPAGNMPRNTDTTPAAMKAVSQEKTNARGRTAKTTKTTTDSPKGTEPQTPQVMRREANRPTSAGVKKRGDRRDTAPDPGMRKSGHNRSIRQAGSGALAGKKAMSGKRVSNERGRGNTKR